MHNFKASSEVEAEMKMDEKEEEEGCNTEARHNELVHIQYQDLDNKVEQPVRCQQEHLQ